MNIIKQPSSIEEVIKNAELYYVTQFQTINKNKMNTDLFRLNNRHLRGYGTPIYKFQFRKEEDKYFVVFIDGYGQRKKEIYNEDIHLTYFNMIFNNEIEANNKNKLLKISVFKNKNFNTDIIYADNIKERLFIFLNQKYKNPIIIPEFTIGKNIIDILMIHKDKIHLFEIKSSQDSFTRIEEQLNSSYTIGDYINVVLDENKIDKFENEYKDKFPNTGLIKINNNKITQLNSAKRNKNKAEIFKYLWSNEIKDMLRNLKGFSNLNSTLNEIFFYYTVTKQTDRKKFILSMLNYRYEELNKQFKLEPSSIGKGKGFIKINNYPLLEDYCLKHNINISSPTDFLKEAELKFSNILKKEPILKKWLNIPSNKYADLSENFKDNIEKLPSTKVGSFIQFINESNLFDRKAYGTKEGKVLLFYLYKKRILTKLLSEFEGAN